jgi:hypothetical protein
MNDRSTDATGTRRQGGVVPLILAWGFVGIPLAWGVVKTILNALKLFQ